MHYFFLTESEDIVITVTALLASLNSCCNPWIYMFFSGHLLQDSIQSFPCCQKLKQTLNKEDSESISRRQTSFTNNRSPTNSLETWRESPNSSKSMKFIPISSWAMYTKLMAFECQNRTLALYLITATSYCTVTRLIEKRKFITYVYDNFALMLINTVN